jgi:hypothetical protein
MSRVSSLAKNGYRVTTKPLPREDVQVMNRMRKAALTLVAALLSVGALGIAAPAHAMDTNWPCPGCIAAHR